MLQKIPMPLLLTTHSRPVVRLFKGTIFVTILHVYHNISLCFNQNTVIIIMFYDDDDDDDDESMHYFGKAL